MPVKPGDVIRPLARVTQKKETRKSRWVLLDIEVKNQRGETVAVGEAMAEFPALPA
jgi:acyl dehydratase